MHLRNRHSLPALCGFLAALIPVSAYAQGIEVTANAGVVFAFILGFIALSFLLMKLAMGIVNVSLLDTEPISSIESRQPYLPSRGTIVGTLMLLVILFLMSLKTLGGIAPFGGPDGYIRATWFFAGLAVFCIAIQWLWPRSKEYVFAITIGTAVVFAFLCIKKVIFEGSVANDPFFMAIGVVAIFLMWRLLFGPWQPHVKSAVLATFILWIAAHIIWGEAPEERIAHGLAFAAALVPALMWVVLFLRYHTQRLGLAVLMFLSGMLSTAPILFYDVLVRSRIELQFFLFRIVPESFSQSSSAFVSGNLIGLSGLHSTMIATLISFLLVGLIEEFSKYWVLKKSGSDSFRSIDDVMQLSIIVAIGFAFAENILNPSYFNSFVREYLLGMDVDWASFTGNVLGRSILTNMVHIVSTGVLGYFFGLAIFARPYLEDAAQKGRTYFFVKLMHHFFRFPQKTVFRRQMLLLGFILAILLHGFFNFLVTLPDMLPGNPRTLGDLFQAGEGSFLHYIALLLFPSLFYVVGGFWLLTSLFYKEENRKVRGRLVVSDTFVKDQAWS